MREALLKRPEELPHALQPAIQFSLRSGIRNANMLARAESLARNGGHVRFAQQSSGHIRSGFQPASSEERRNIRIRVKRSLRQSASSHPEWTAARSPHDPAAEYIHAAFARRIPAGPSARLRQPSARSTSDSKLTGSVASPLRWLPPPGPSRSPAASRSWHRSSRASPARQIFLYIRAARPPKNSFPCNSGRRSTRPTAPRCRARAPGEPPTSCLPDSSPRPTDSMENSE